MGMTKIEILADLSGWLVRSGYLALKVVSNSGETTNSSCSRFPHLDHLDQEYTGRRNCATMPTETGFSFPSTSKMGDILQQLFPILDYRPLIVTPENT